MSAPCGFSRNLSELRRSRDRIHDGPLWLTPTSRLARQTPMTSADFRSEDRKRRACLEAAQANQRAAEVALATAQKEKQTLEARVAQNQSELDVLRTKAADTARVESELAEAKF
jgi:hypothetical protein